MNHPNIEQWMSYLYGESASAEKEALARHLRHCDTCARQVAEWQAVQTRMDRWKIRQKRARTRSPAPLLKWAAAAAVLAMLAFGAGRLTSPSPDLRKFRETIESELRQQLREEFSKQLHDELAQGLAAAVRTSTAQAERLLADYGAAWNARQTEDTEALFARLNHLELQHDADYVRLKKDLDTVAVLTDAGLRHAQLQLTQLADAGSSGAALNPVHN